jgi:hypothetical protein
MFRPTHTQHFERIFSMSFRTYALVAATSFSIMLSTNASAAVAGRYRFTYQPAQSGLNATLSATVSTSGTLIGNYDAVTNSTGTRTKPGIFGSFGSTENLPVAVQDLSVAAEGPIATQTAGSFDLQCDSATGLASVTAFSIDALSTGSIKVPFSVSLFTEAFRTRNPTATYPSIPLEIPVGSVVVTRLGFVQAGPAVGTITSIDGVQFDVDVAVPVALSLTATVLDQVIEVNDGPVVPLSLVGVASFSGSSATFSASTPLQFEQVEQPAEPLPSFDLPLPTTNPDTPANVVASLVLDEVGVSLLGQLSSSATGERILPPCPADFNGDRAVNGADLGTLLAGWGPCATDCAGDVNNDGIVDGVDLGSLLAAWGSCD